MNPLLLRLIPFAVSAAAGFAIAWGIQGLRITNAEQEFVEYKQDQVEHEQQRKRNADKQRDEAAARYAVARAELEQSISEGEVLKRCIAAGRCGGARNPSGLREPTRRAGAGLSAPSRSDETRIDAVPFTGESAAPGVVFDCAYTTLQLNHLQADIEAQPGYKE